jgi:putative transposase
MPKKRHTEKQILAALHQGESGTKVAEICRRMGISQATYFFRRDPQEALRRRLREVAAVRVR